MMTRVFVLERTVKESTRGLVHNLFLMEFIYVYSLF